MDLYIRQQNIEDWFYIPVWLTVQSIVKGDEAIAKLFKHQVPKNYVHKHCKNQYVGKARLTSPSRVLS